MTRWFRSYVGMCRDPKLMDVAAESGQGLDRVLFVWQSILEDACEQQESGKFDASAKGIAFLLHCKAADIQSILDALETAGLTASNVVAAWSRRQFESDTSTKRVKEFRERKGNVAETVVKQDETFHRRCETAPDTEADTDTEAEEEKKTKSASAPKGKFVFEGRAIRLTAEDFDRWRSAYHAIPDLQAELTKADDYYASLPQKRGNVFFAASKWLEKAHRQALEGNVLVSTKFGPMKAADAAPYKGAL